MQRTGLSHQAHVEAAMHETWEAQQLSATIGLREIPIPAEAMPVLKKVLAEPPAAIPAPRVQKADAHFLRGFC